MLPLHQFPNREPKILARACRRGKSLFDADKANMDALAASAALHSLAIDEPIQGAPAAGAAPAAPAPAAPEAGFASEPAGVAPLVGAGIGCGRMARRTASSACIRRSRSAMRARALDRSTLVPVA